MHPHGYMAPENSLEHVPVRSRCPGTWPMAFTAAEKAAAQHRKKGKKILVWEKEEAPESVRQLSNPFALCRGCPRLLKKETLGPLSALLRIGRGWFRSGKCGRQGCFCQTDRPEEGNE